MDSAREAVSKFTGRKGQRTDVDERVNPAVTSETIKPTRLEESTQAVDREVHQDHYHTTVQPLQDRQVLPEQHSHRQAPVEEREFNHGNESETRERLQREAAKFQDSTQTERTQNTEAVGQGVTGEHVHHHVHEQVQPVINKETIAPEVVHTTVPIHETHHASTQHHGTSVLPTKNLSEFQGLHEGKEGVRHSEYDGVPKQYNKTMQAEQLDADKFPLKEGVDGPESHNQGGTGLAGTEPFRDDGHLAGGKGQGNGINAGRDGNFVDNDTGAGRDTTGTSNQTSTTGGKPSLMDKLNPKIDSNGDGKAGFMK